MVNHNCVGAIAAFSTVIVKQPRLADAYGYRSLAENGCEHYGNALADANAALKLDPKNSLGLTARGKVYASTGKVQDSLDDSLKLLALD